MVSTLTKISKAPRPTGRKNPPRVVWDESDRQEDCIRINQLHDPSAGVLVVHVPPRTAGSLNVAILDALGKKFSGSDFVRAREDVTAIKWLRAYRIHDLILYGSDRISRSVEYLINDGPRPWFVTSSSETADVRREQLGVKMLTSVEDMIRHFAERPVREEKPEPRAEEIPHLPEHDFVSFLAVCHQKIRDRNAFASVEKEFHVGFESINDLFDRNAGEIPSYQQLMIEIRTLLLGAGGDRHSICRLRGIQTALFWRGLSLQVNIRELLAVMHIDRQTAGVDALSLAIRQQVDPVPAAIAALTYVTALDPGDVAKLRKGNVEHDVSRIEFNGILWDVPEQIRAPIAMCRDRYATNGHTGNTRLVLKNGEPFTERDIEMALWHFSQETGCYISPGQMHHEPTEKISHRLIDKHLDLVALDGTSGLV